MNNQRGNPMRVASPRMAGFTLIEVLAALVIVSIGMLAVIEAVSQTASNGAYLRDKTIAHWVALNQLTKVRLDTRAPKIDKTSDEVEMAQRRWRWTMNVSQTAVESVRRIDINVAPAEAAKNSSLASLTGFYGTAISPGVQPVAWSGQNTGVAPAPNPNQTGGSGTSDDNDNSGSTDAQSPNDSDSGDPAPAEDER